jgi:methionyl-tRNA synthetase
MSKSRGTFVRAATYLKHLNPAYLRYYYASKLSPRVDDLDLNPDEFVTKVNSDLVGKVVNLASRTARFVEKTGLADCYNHELDSRFHTNATVHSITIADAYEACDYSKAMRQIMFIADEANKFVEQFPPWKLANGSEDQQQICTIALNLFRQIVVFLSPVLPDLTKQADQLFGVPISHWNNINEPILGRQINPFKAMLTRVEPTQVQAMIEDSKESAPVSSAASTPGSPPRSDVAALVAEDGPEALQTEPLAVECTIDDFTKVDLRVARILTAEEVPDARKLLKLTLSLGGDVRKTVFAGIKKAYKPEDLVGRLVICVANLAPRQMKFGLSEGMVAAAGPGGDEVFLLSPDTGAKPGQRVH